MSNFDEITARKENKERKTMSQTERREEWQKQVDAAAQKAVSSIDEFLKYLDVQSRFDRYSANNDLLIYAQRPDATRLKSMELWNKDKLWVREGAKAVYIYELQNNTKGDKTYKNLVRKPMFDISDVKDAVPEKRELPDVKAVTKAMFDSKTVEIRTVPDYPDTRQFGATYEVQDNCIYARANMPIEQIFTDVAMALSQARMAENNPDYTNASKQFEARCSAYILAKKYGIPTAKLQIDSLPSQLASMTPKDLHEVFDDINKNVRTIESGIYKELAKAREAKETEVSPKAKSPKGDDAR